jgi:hypothetical protein
VTDEERDLLYRADALLGAAMRGEASKRAWRAEAEALHRDIHRRLDRPRWLPSPGPFKVVGRGR